MYTDMEKERELLLNDSDSNYLCGPRLVSSHAVAY